MTSDSPRRRQGGRAARQRNRASSAAPSKPFIQRKLGTFNVLDEEGLTPHAVPEVWVVMLDPFDVFIDITDVFDAKVAALSAHSSQTADFDVEVGLREWALSITEANDLPAGRLTEAFRRVDTA